jgi:hypothetical protein
VGSLRGKVAHKSYRYIMYLTIKMPLHVTQKLNFESNLLVIVVNSNSNNNNNSHLNTSANIIREIRSDRITWAGHMAYM